MIVGGAIRLETQTIDPLNPGRDTGNAASDISKVEKQGVSGAGHNHSVQ